MTTSNTFKGFSKEYIKSQINYEKAEGTHTYTMCKCGRHGCRSIKCYQCWEEELNKNGVKK